MTRWNVRQARRLTSPPHSPSSPCQHRHTPPAHRAELGRRFRPRSGERARRGHVEAVVLQNLRVFRSARSVEDFNTDDAAGFIVIHDDAVGDFLALLDWPVRQIDVDSVRSAIDFSPAWSFPVEVGGDHVLRIGFGRDHAQHDTPARQTLEVGPATRRCFHDIRVTNGFLNPSLVNATPGDLKLGVLVVLDHGLGGAAYPSASLLFFTRSAST